MSNLPTRISPQDVIARVRGHAVILDADLAALYGVAVKRLNEQVRRNADRFPEDFVFQLRAGMESFEVAICDLKGSGRSSLFALRFHGAWSDHGRQ